MKSSRARPRHRGLRPGGRLGPRVTTGLKVAVLLLAAVALYVDLRSTVSGAPGRGGLVVVARQRSGLVVFDVYENAGWLWPRPRTRAITALSVADWVSGTALWEIEASKPRRAAVTYAQVPTGFNQTIPATGVPPALRSGGFYGVTVHGNGASGVTTFNLKDEGHDQ